MKRFIALILLLSMMLGCLASLSGCSKSDNQSVKMGQWLSMINEAFGMYSYVQEEPYFSDIDVKNEYFEAVQVATEWEVTNTTQKIDVNKSITWKEALVSLVNAGNFTSSDSSDDEKIECAIKNFDSSIRKYWMNREIKYSNAIVLLATAQRLWANRTFEERVEEVRFKEGVKDFSGNKEIAENYIINSDTTVLSSANEVDLKVGDVYVLPTNDNFIGTKVYKVESISQENGKVFIKNSDNIDLYDIAENIFLQETIVPTAENTVVYDAYGNPLNNKTVNVVPQSNTASDHKVINLVATDSPLSVEPMANLKTKHEFEVDGWVIELSYDLDGVLDLEVAVGKSNKKEGTEWKFGAGVSDVKVTNEIDYSWFKLNSALVKVDYESEVFFEAGVKDKLVDKVAAPYNNGNGQGLTNLKKIFENDFKNPFKDTDSKGAKTIKIASIDVWSIGIARVCLDLNFQVSVDGSFKISLTNHDTKGVEYKNKNLRFINTSDSDLDFEVEAKTEATLGIGPALYTVGLKKAIIGVQGKFGAGAKVSATLHLVDTENHLIEEMLAGEYPPEAYRALLKADITTDVESIKRAAEAQGGTYSNKASGDIKLYADVCIDIDMYKIVRLEIIDKSYVAELIGGKIKTSIEFLGEKNGKFGYAHIENFDFISGFSNAVFGSKASKADQCTKQYKPFDDVTESKENSVSNSDTILKGDQILLAEMSANIVVGQKYYTIVQEIPKGYDLEDLKIKVDDAEIVTVNDDGAIVGKKVGSTVVTVYTSDNKYSAYCALTVTQPETVDFEPL